MLKKIPFGVWCALGFVILAILSALILYLVYELEESRKEIRTFVVNNADGGVFTVQIRKKDQESDLLIVCNEEEFQEAFGHFARFLNIKSDPLKVPGGPMIVALADVELSQELQPAKRATVEILKRYSPKRIILVAHSECLLYDTIAAWQDNLNEVKQRQHIDLMRAQHTIQTWFPNTEVEIFYADRQGDRLVFYPMHPGEIPPLPPLKLDPDLNRKSQQ